MHSFRILTALAILTGLAGDTRAGPYLFSFSGEAVPFVDNDALSGAFVQFAFIIDSDAIPDDQSVGDEFAVASYSSSILEPTLTISGSLASDGMYDAEGPFTMTVADTDVLFEDSVSVSQSHDGLFEVPGTIGVAIFIDLWDPFADVLTDTNVPIDISLEDFYDIDYFLTSPIGGLNVLYKVQNMEMTITPVPEPTSLLLLAFGGAAVLRRRRGGM